MNEVIKTIHERRAIRKYTNTLIDHALIEDIIAAGRMAPSALNKQPWYFYVLTDKKDIHAFSEEIGWVVTREMAKIKPDAKENALKKGSGIFRHTHQVDYYKSEDIIFHGAPVVVFITSSRANKWAALDVGMCAQNMMLAAKSLGLDSCPVGLGKYVEGTLIYSKLRVPKANQVLIALIIGYGDENPKIHDRIKNNVSFI